MSSCHRGSNFAQQTFIEKTSIYAVCRTARFNPGGWLKLETYWNHETSINKLSPGLNHVESISPKQCFAVMFGSFMRIYESYTYLFVYKHSIVITWMWKICDYRDPPTLPGSPGLAPDSRQNKAKLPMLPWFPPSKCPKKITRCISRWVSAVFLPSSSVLQLLLPFLHFPNHAYCLGYDVGQFRINCGDHSGYSGYNFHHGPSFITCPYVSQQKAKYIDAATCCPCFLSTFFVKSQNLHRWRADPWTEVAPQIVHTLTWPMFFFAEQSETMD